MSITASTSATPARGSKRPRLDTPPVKQLELVQPPDLERNVKTKYRNTCVVCGTRTTWLPSQIGNGIEACHLIPKASYKSYPWRDDMHSDIDSWNATNPTSNCMTMDSLCHTFHDNRLLAIHPVGIAYLYSILLLTFNRNPGKSDCLHHSQPLWSAATEKPFSKMNLLIQSR
jgi:HNH endonuclease